MVGPLNSVLPKPRRADTSSHPGPANHGRGLAGAGKDSFASECKSSSFHKCRDGESWELTPV
jgi:hypothetical protein